LNPPDEYNLVVIIDIINIDKVEMIRGIGEIFDTIPTIGSIIILKKANRLKRDPKSEVRMILDFNTSFLPPSSKTIDTEAKINVYIRTGIVFKDTPNAIIPDIQRIKMCIIKAGKVTIQEPYLITSGMRALF
jgi:pyruvate-formate lyase